jgi:hypothetical protein
MLRPYPQYGAISDPWGDVGQSSYNALQITFNRRFSHGLTFMLGYTYSKEMDNLATDRDPFNNNLERAPGLIDHPHVFTGTFVYALPFGSGHKLTSGNAVIRNLVSHWNLSGIVTFSSGGPLSITANGCIAGGILSTCFPSYNPSFTGPVSINGGYGSGSVLGSTPTVYLNKAAFIEPAPYTVGDVPRTEPYGLFAPHIADVDISIRREFKIKERVTIAIQADAFNINNAVYFTAPGANIDSASFGTVTSQNNQPRKLQLNARVTF